MKLLLWAIFFVLCLPLGPFGWLIFGVVAFTASLGQWSRDCQERWTSFRGWVDQGMPITFPVVMSTLAIILFAAAMVWVNHQPVASLPSGLPQ